VNPSLTRRVMIDGFAERYHQTCLAVLALATVGIAKAAASPTWRCPIRKAFGNHFGVLPSLFRIAPAIRFVAGEKDQRSTLFPNELLARQSAITLKGNAFDQGQSWRLFCFLDGEPGVNRKLRATSAWR